MSKGRRIGIILTLIGGMAGANACSTLQSFFAVKEKEHRAAPIENPFPDYFGGAAPRENIVLRTRKGDRAIEVELPNQDGSMSDLVVPVSPAFMDQGRSPASEQELALRAPSLTDREITSRFSSASLGQDGERRQIESSLGVVPTEDPIPERDSSYLAGIDRIKQLYRSARYEAALLALDDILKAYPTDDRLYAMRGTLLDRIGQADLALKSWNQALRLNPSNEPLRRFIERKQQRRGLASP